MFSWAVFLCLGRQSFGVEAGKVRNSLSRAFVVWPTPNFSVEGKATLAETGANKGGSRNVLENPRMDDVNELWELRGAKDEASYAFWKRAFAQNTARLLCESLRIPLIEYICMI